MTRFRCVSCGHGLTRDCRWGWLENHNPEASDQARPVPSGIVMALPDGIVSVSLADDQTRTEA